MEKLKSIPTLPRVRWDRLKKWCKSPAAIRLWKNGGALAAGFFLAGARFLGAPLPAAVCLVAALGCSLPALCAYLGAAVGSLLLWQSGACLLTLAAGFLALTVAWALQDFPVAASPLLPCAAAFGPGLLAGLLLLVSEDITVRAVLVFIIQMAVLPLGTLAARSILREPKGLPMCAALFALVSGSGSIFLPGEISLGAVIACFCLSLLAGTGAAFPAAALAGLALDWSAHPGVSSVAALTVAQLAASLLPARRKYLRYCAFLLACGSVILLDGGEGGALFPAAVLGAGLALPVPPLPMSLEAAGKHDPTQQLKKAAAVLEQVHHRLEEPTDLPCGTDLQTVMQQTADRVCARCGYYAVCWTQHLSETGVVLREAARVRLDRGSMSREDFPPEFRGKCRYFPEFLMVFDENLRMDAQRQQRQRQRRELRAVLSGQYRILADFLRQCGGEADAAPPARYLPRPACRCRGKGGSAVSGDSAACLTRGNRCWLLLCDGMGTGPDAAADSRRAVSLLTGLLRAGMDTADALETLNAAAILQEDAGFSTVDLAEIDLLTGDGVLYKWGGGPSLLLTADGPIKMGTATLPPGVGVGGTHQAQRIRLSLGRGEVLILLSDGIGGEEAEAILRQKENRAPEELAAALMGQECSVGEDDGTAAVLKLQPVSAQ